MITKEQLAARIQRNTVALAKGLVLKKYQAEWYCLLGHEPPPWMEGMGTGRLHRSEPEMQEITPRGGPAQTILVCDFADLERRVLASMGVPRAMLGKDKPWKNARYRK